MARNMFTQRAVKMSAGAAALAIAWAVFTEVASAERPLKDEIIKPKIFVEQEAIFARVINFLWQAGGSSYQPVWPEMKFGWKIVVGSVVGFFGAALGSVGGVGGGGIFVPMLALIVGFDPKSSTAISKCMIMGAAGSTVYFNLRLRHPTLDMPLIDYDLALLFQPMLMLGISIGVAFNVVFADWMVTVLLIILFLGTAAKALMKGVETWKKETMMKKEAENMLESETKQDEGSGEDYKPLPSGPASSQDEEVPVTRNIYWKELSLLMYVWVAFLIVQIVKTYTETCSTTFWIMNSLQVPIALSVTLFEAICLRKGTRVIASKGKEITNWKLHQIFLYCSCGIVAGMVGGLLGLGGGFILGPLFLELGIPPQVASATSTFAMLFSSSMSVVQYYLLNRFPVPYAAYFVVVATIAAFTGQHVVRKIIAVLGRASIIIFILALTIFVSAISLGGVGIANMVEKMENREYMGFENFYFEMATKIDPPAESPTSVLEDEDACETKIDVKLTEVEEKLLEERVKEEESEMGKAPEQLPHLNDTQYNKLDELLTQTQLYSQFLLEKMDNITLVGANQPSETVEEKNVEEKKGRGRKRKAAANFDNRKAKKAVEAMLTRSKEGVKIEDENLTEEQRIEKEQKELVPLLTGGKLKSYQIKGVKWLISLWQNGLNGILADQMGLGKTIQTIGFLAHLKGNGMDGPYLVIAPLSTLANWVNEISRFTPSINAIVYHGDKKQRDEIRRKHMPSKIGPKFPIIVTSYEIAMADARRCLRHYSWKYLVVDEGHRLKNSKCILLRELKHLCVDNKILLTGTPLQNNLAELWSLLNFILPDIFSSHEEFESWFDLAGKCSNEAMKEELEEKRRAQMVAKLHAILRPFLLRRMKSDVEQMLPRKKEIILYACMTEHQKHFQDLLINKTLENYLLERGDHVRGMKGKLNNLMIQLRKNCNHPDLLESAFDGSYFYPPVEQIVEQCGKFSLLDRLLKYLLARKHKVLIFSQWTKILDIMDYYFSEKGLEVCRIDGSVRLEDRRNQIAAFNDVDSNYRIFLLSTRAGGLGINLTAADTCILYDSDWNPQMDLQAMDRCHRIGQTKPVHVYRLATAQSVEGRILRRAFSKLKLEHVVIGKGQFHQDKAKSSTDFLEEEDLIALLREEESAEDKMIQMVISDEDLERVLDRSDLMGSPADHEEEKANGVADVLPLKGPGWEVVLPTAGGGMLSTLTS
ncbi:hypothetical protein DVH24_026473 [Malus domestica]|uniref:ATP-dependent DNA helicase DDM1 n=1 Tax=Malus domestica TaxID=3750 RepID=A0A498KIQ2_MALDO|nr:hypothetical protein DVH24_026473 [Malus domestica]